MSLLSVLLVIDARKLGRTGALTIDDIVVVMYAARLLRLNSPLNCFSSAPPLAHNHDEVSGKSMAGPPLSTS